MNIDIDTACSALRYCAVLLTMPIILIFSSFNNTVGYFKFYCDLFCENCQIKICSEPRYTYLI